ncbi:MAG TPA: YIEGIA domain-containing protein [Oscillospiraceae bacterium]|nr:YIEGIA domain-containing protein [Oscillospiraceae bacterium]
MLSFPARHPQALGIIYQPAGGLFVFRAGILRKTEAVILETAKSLSIGDIYVIVTGIVMGTTARLITLKVDFRQIPSYPNAYFNCIVLGVIASALGSIAIPAILARDFVSITFLTVAVSQFREVRSAERDSLGKLEHTEYVRRGDAYIDGIAKTFESRNYISLVTALASVLVMKLVDRPEEEFLTVLSGVAAGLLVLFLCYRFTKGKTVGHICTARIGTIEVRGSELYVDGIFVTNYLGTDRSRELFRTEGIAVVLEPRDPMCRVTLENFGQRQAILFEAVRALGVKRYRFIRRHFQTGNVAIAFVPVIRDPDKLMEAVLGTPILENSRKVGRIIKTSFGG